MKLKFSAVRTKRLVIVGAKAAPRITLFGLFTLFFMAPVQAIEGSVSSQHEIAASLASVQLQSTLPSVFSVGSGSARLSYGYFLTHFLQMAGSYSLFMTSSTNQLPGETSSNAMIGPQFNFAVDDTGPLNAYFISVSAGINYQKINEYRQGNYNTPALTNRSFAYGITLGKRFAILPHLHWAPAFSLSTFTGIDIFNSNVPTKPVYSFMPVRISAVF